MAAVRGRKLLFSWLVFGILLPALPATARAGGKTIVMLDIEGERDDRLSKSVERMVKNGHEILPGSTYRDAARRLRAEKLTPNNVMKVCGYLKVDGVLDGTLVQDDDGYRFIVRLRSAADGVIEKKFPIRLKEPRLTEKIANQLAERLIVSIDNLPAVDKDGDDATRVASARDKRRTGDDDDDAETGRSKARKSRVAAASAAASGKSRKVKKRRKVGLGEVEPDDDMAGADRMAGASEDKGGEKAGRDDARVAHAAKKAKDDDDEPVEDDELVEEGGPRRVAMRDGGDDDGEGSGGDGDVEGSLDAEAARVNLMGPRASPFVVDLGISFVGRKLTFDYSGTPDQAPPGYSGTLVPGAYLEAEAYPAGFEAGGGALADFGIGIVVDRVFSLNSTVEDEGMAAVSLPTRMWHYGANLRYRHNFGEGADGITVHGDVGYNTTGFAIDKGDATGGVDVPNVNYKYVDVGAGGRIPIAGPLAFLAEAKFLAALKTGAIQTVEQYGPAIVKGFEGEGAIEVQITSSIHARAGGRITQLGYKFDGDGALDDRDGNGENDVSGASDRFLGGFVTAGYSF